MRQEYQQAFGACFALALGRSRYRLQLTQAQMAALLIMDRRSYAGLECGENSCSALTLALFLLRCCEDPTAFLSEVRDALERCCVSL